MPQPFISKNAVVIYAGERIAKLHRVKYSLLLPSWEPGLNIIEEKQDWWPVSGTPRVIAHAMAPLPPLKVAYSVFMVMGLALLKFQ